MEVNLCTLIVAPVFLNSTEFYHNNNSNDLCHKTNYFTYSESYFYVTNKACSMLK